MTVYSEEEAMKAVGFLLKNGASKITISKDENLEGIDMLRDNVYDIFMKQLYDPDYKFARFVIDYEGTKLNEWLEFNMDFDQEAMNQR